MGKRSRRAREIGKTALVVREPEDERKPERVGEIGERVLVVIKPKWIGGLSGARGIKEKAPIARELEEVGRSASKKNREGSISDKKIERNKRTGKVGGMEKAVLVVRTPD